MLRYLILVLMGCGTLAAQQPVSIINGDPLSCFSMSGAAALNLTIVNVQGQPFSRAWHIKTPNNSANPWDIRIRCFNTLPASKGDTILARFWMRTLVSGARPGMTTLVVEKGRDPYTKSVQWTVSTGAEWKLAEIPFTMLETYSGTGSDGYNISFWVTFEPQEIEIGGLAVLNYGPNFPYGKLGLTAWPYEGREPNAAWRAAAAERIERIRKADIVVLVRDETGGPLANAQVRVRMKRQAFGFGSAVAGQGLMDGSADGIRYRELIPQLFNKVVLENDLKWPNWETSREPARFALDWLPAHGITDVRGHNVIWPGQSHLPSDVVKLLSGPPDVLRKRINDHIAEIMAWTRGKVTEWDVLNEPYSNKDVQAVLGDAEMAAWFKKAREADPGVKLYINDYDIVEDGGFNFAHQDAYYNIIKGILDRGGPLDGIGLQSHFSGNLTSPERVLAILDRFAAFGKELEVTEFDVTVGDEQVQADFTRDFMTACFSHPSATGFLMWGFWEGRHWRPQAAMIRRDWSIKPNGEVWKDLIFNQWWTDVRGVTGTDGVFRVRGFLGDYDVEATVGGQMKTVPLKVVRGSPNYALFGKQTAGKVTAAGIVNAASYSGTAVAPGEMVTIYGAGFGPRQLSLSGYDPDGVLATVAGDTRVLFDGLAAPVVHSLEGQVSAIVPYSVAGSTSISVEYQGAASNPVSLPVAASAPGLFTLDYSGKGQAVALNVNDDGSMVLNSAAHPAQKGRFITIFLTGAGQTNPRGIDGKLPAYPGNPVPVQPVSVVIGGVESRAADNWQGMVFPGVLQLNVRIPPNAPSGLAVALTASVGSASSQPGVTLSIQ